MDGQDGDRLDALLASLEEIVDDGRFERRLPVSERADVWDGVHTAINLLLDVLVSKLAAAEESARRAHVAEERFQALSDASFEGVVVVRDGRVVDSNQAFASMLGYGRDELEGRDVRDLVAPPARAAIDERLEAGSAGAYRTRARRRDGSELEVETFSRRVSYRGEVAHVAAVRDVTEATEMLAAVVRSERRLAERTHRLETLLEAVPVGVLIESAEGRIERANESLLRMLGLRGRAPEPLSRTRASFLDEIVGVFADGAAFRAEIERWTIVASPAAGTFATRDGRALRVVYGPIGEAAAGGHLWLYEDATAERREEQLRRGLLAGIVQAQDDERRRVAQELHDETGQSLTALMVGLRTLAESTSDPAVRTRATSLGALTEQALLETSRLARGLHPAVLADLGLAAALERLARDLTAHHGIATDVEIRGSLRRLPRPVETTIYRIVQEAVGNVGRHAGARSASIVLWCDDERVRVLVEDDGAGFDAELGTERGLGLPGMRERAAALGGTLSIDSSPGEGTTVALDLRLGQNGVA